MRISGNIDKIEFIELYGDNDQEANLSVIILISSVDTKLIKCLESLKNQTENNFEIIIINNGIGNVSKEKLQVYKIKYIKLRHNFGSSVGRNIGIYYAKGDIVCFLDDDAIADKNFVKEHRQAYKERNILALRGKCLPLTNAYLNMLQCHYDLGNEIRESLINLEGNSSFKKNILLEIDGFNEDLFGHEGIDISYRIYKIYRAKSKIIYLPTAIIYHDYADNLRKYLNKMIRHLIIMDEKLWKFDPDITEFIKSYQVISVYPIYRNKLNTLDKSKLNIARVITLILKVYARLYKIFNQLRSQGSRIWMN